MKLDLFKLHDKNEDTTARKFIVAKGRNLKSEIKKLIEKIELTNTELVKHLMKRFNISIASAERLVYLKREWFPLLFIEELLNMTNKLDKKFDIQDKIEFLKATHPPVKILKAPKKLSVSLCKITGAHAADGTIYKNYFCITDGYKKNILAFNKWLKEEFNLDFKIKKISENEWGINFHNKIFARYLTKIFEFPSGCKQYTVSEPEIIKDSQLKFRNAFALGALTFEAGIGIKHEVEFCVSSKLFRDSIVKILKLNKIKHKCMQKQSSGYWRFWSNSLTNEEAAKWMDFFEPHTEKWQKLDYIIKGFNNKVTSFRGASRILGEVYPSKSSSKIYIEDVLFAIRDLKEVHRYKLVEYIIQKKNLKSYGGKWAHSLKHYLDILKMANIISVEKQRFGPKKSFGTIVREVYMYNEDISKWRVP